jgi:hypothetical protein
MTGIGLQNISQEEKPEAKKYRVTQKKGTFENPNKNSRNPRKIIY